MMNAFLVLITIIVGPAGPMAVTVKVPWSSMEHCQRYLEDPAEIELDFGDIQVLKRGATCELRGENKPT